MLLKNGLVALPEGIRKTSVLIKNGKIDAIGDNLRAENEIDLHGLYLTAGFIDIHNHGGYGYDYMDATEEAFNGILRFHIDNGITSCVASTVTAPKATVIKTIECARRVMAQERKYARLLGVHLEGPYLSYQNRGAHNPDLLSSPAKDDYTYMLDNADIIKHITVSPELDGTAEFTKKAVEKNIVISMGHDNAILPEILPVVEAGATNLTHLYCAMSGVVMRDNKRYVGLREYGLINDSLSAELIADNHHLTPELIKMIFRCKSADKISLISDCLRAGGMKKDGRLYNLGDKDDITSQKFMVSDGVAVLSDGSRYAGSIQPISQMLKNVVLDGGVPFEEAIKTVTSTPAAVIRESDRIGSIEIGKFADLNVLDEELNIKMTVIDGEIYKENL